MKYYLAPMEGITGYIFRRVYDRCFPKMDKYFTPFLSPNQTGRLSPKEQKDVDPANNRGIRLIPQILTNSSEDFIRTAKTLKAMGYCEVNLNLGCPSGTVVSKKRGAGFLAYPSEVDGCLYDIFSRLDMKISVKTRLGKEAPEEFEELLSIYNRYPLEELIVHPRIQKDYYRNRPRMEFFKTASKASLNPLCYNGDLFKKEDAEALEQEFPGLPAMMMGRGILANPGLLCPVQEKERVKEFHDCLYDAYCREYLIEAGQKVVLFKMKEIWCYLMNTFENGKKYGKKIKKSQSLTDYETAVAALFRECQLIPGGYEGTP